MSDCFVVSQLFSVTRRFKLRSTPTQLYVRLSIIPLSQQLTYVSSIILMHYVLAFVCLHFAWPDTRVLNSLEELCFTRIAAVNSFARVLNPRERSVYIVIYRQTVSFYHKNISYIYILYNYFMPIYFTALYSIYIYIYILFALLRQHSLEFLVSLSGSRIFIYCETFHNVFSVLFLLRILLFRNLIYSYDSVMDRGGYSVFSE